MDRRDRHLRLIRRFGSAETAQAISSLMATRGLDPLAFLTDEAVHLVATRLARVETEGRSIRRYNRQLARAG